MQKTKEAICIDNRNERHTLANIKYDKNGLIKIADLNDPWNYKDFITQKDIKIVAYLKKQNT